MKTPSQSGSDGRVPGPPEKRLRIGKPAAGLAVAALVAFVAVAGLACWKRCGGGAPALALQPPAGAPRQEGALRQGPPPSPNEGLFVGEAFEGTFLQLWQEHTTWAQERWAAEFAQLRRAGMKMVVVQWTQYDELDFTAPGPDRTSPLDRVVAAADAAGMDLCVGLSLRKSWWKADCFRAPYMREELARNRQLATRLYPLLRGHRCFYGWYIPHEITDVGAEGDCGAEVRSFFGALTGHLNALDALKPIMASGYTDRDRANLVHFVTWWTLFLRESGVDVLVFQDGAGLARKAPWPSVAPLIDALCALAGEVGTDVWLVGEVFAQTHGQPIDEGGFKAEPAEFARVRQQLDLLGAFKRRLLAYSYFDYMRPSAGGAASRLFDEYVSFADARAAARSNSAAARTPAIEGNVP